MRVALIAGTQLAAMPTANRTPARNTNTDLLRAARDGIGDHAIDPDSGQSQRDQREDPQQVVMTRGPAKEAETISSIVRMWYGGRS